MEVQISTTTTVEPENGNQILTGLARALGYNPNNNSYGTVFKLMFPTIMRDWETLEREDFESLYGTLALNGDLDPEETIDYVLSIATSRAH